MVAFFLCTGCYYANDPSLLVSVTPRSASTGGPAENFDAIFRIGLERSWLFEQGRRASSDYSA